MTNSKTEQDAKVRRLINKHEHWVSQWAECRGAFSRTMISPRGKKYTYSGYIFEVEKHMQKTVGAILKVFRAGEQQ